MKKQQSPRRHRRVAFMLIEFMIAFAFLALVTGVTVKMHVARTELDRVETQRLTDQLRIENVAEELSTVPPDELLAFAEVRSHDSDVRINVEPVSSDTVTGWHVVISIESENAPLRHHLWRLERAK